MKMTSSAYAVTALGKNDHVMITFTLKLKQGKIPEKLRRDFGKPREEKLKAKADLLHCVIRDECRL